MAEVIHILTSDTHFGDGSGSDDSLKFEELFLDFQGHVLGWNEMVVWHMVGDWLELDQLITPKGFFDLTDKHKDMFYQQREFHRTVAYPGNHDAELTKLAAVVPWETTSLYRIYPIGNLKILVTHGHQWDFWCKKGNPIGGYVTAGIGVLEKLGWEDADITLGKLRKHCQETHDIAAAKAAKEMGCDIVIKGHTHNAHTEIYEHVDVFDMGSPITEIKNDPPRIPYVIIREDDVRLEYFTSEAR